MAELPTGTVTFLFTDIEGSTRLIQTLGPESYRAAQEPHDEILRRAIADGGGIEIRTEGDSFFAVFPTATGAVAAAVSAQRELASHPWSEGETIRVRMGLHTGEGRRGGADYVGIDVNRAARIAASGHGGQVLISDPTRALVENSLPDGTTIRDIGTHRLKDIEHPEHLHELIIDGLPADFPPIRTQDISPTNLAPERTSFIGRREEIIRITGLLAETRLLTLTGPGGTGKTRLALRVAEQHLDRFPDGVFLVPLSSVADPALAPSAIATTLGVREDPSRPLIDSVADSLRERKILLVLDNFEQILEAASVVGHLLTVDRGLCVLVTSRAPLRISGEQEYMVSPLALPDPDRFDDLEALRASEAVMLFVERAKAVRPEFELTDDTATAVASITTRLDGLPLAIELAASRSKTLAPTELLDRLERRLPLLTGGLRDAPDRQRTLRGTIEWSYDLLQPEEQHLFARLAVFSGGWTLEAAEVVCGPGSEVPVLDGLESLIDHSLVRRDRGANDRTRLLMLETIREFAGEQLAGSVEEDEVRRRHAWHVVAMVEAAEPELLWKDRTWLDRLEEEHDNIRAALRWSIDSGEAEPGLRIAGNLWQFWRVRSHLLEGRGWMEQLLSLPGAGARTAVRAKALGARGSMAYYHGDQAHIREPYEESFAISKELGDRRAEAEATYNLAFVPLLDHQLSDAEDLLRRAVDLNVALGNPVAAAHANTALALVLAEGGNLDGAEVLLEEARDTFVDAQDLWGIVFASGLVSSFALRRGDNQRARAATLQSLDASEALAVWTWTAIALQGLAILDVREGHPKTAVRLAGSASRLIELAGGAEPPRAMVLMDDPLELVKDELPKGLIDALFKEGRAMDTDEAIALARRES